MARNMPTANKPRSGGRPAQGANSISAASHRPRPAYASQSAPTVVGSGSLSMPKDTYWRGGSLKRLPADATPKVVQL